MKAYFLELIVAAGSRSWRFDALSWFCAKAQELQVCTTPQPGYVRVVQRLNAVRMLYLGAYSLPGSESKVWRGWASFLAEPMDGPTLSRGGSQEQRRRESFVAASSHGTQVNNV